MRKRTSSRWIALAAVALAGSRASADPAELSAALGQSDFVQQAAASGVNFAGAKGIAQRPPAAAAVAPPPDAPGALIRRISLASALNPGRRTRTSFRVGDVVVHVFGDMSENDKGKFNHWVGFAPENGEDLLRKGSKMFHLWGHHQDFFFSVKDRQGNEHKYTAYVKVSITNHMQSRIIVEPGNKSEPSSSWSLQEIYDAVYDAGEQVMIAGKEYRLLYTRNFNETDGEFAGYTGDLSITLLNRQGGKTTAYHWFERDIPHDHVLVSTPKASGDGAADAGTLTLGLRIDPADELEIYAVR